MKTGGTFGVKSGDVRHRASDIGCGSRRRGGTAGQYLLTRAATADTIEKQQTKRSVAQLGRAPALGAGGRGFKSRYSDGTHSVQWTSSLI